MTFYQKTEVFIQITYVGYYVGTCEKTVVMPAMTVFVHIVAFFFSISNFLTMSALCKFTYDRSALLKIRGYSGIQISDSTWPGEILWSSSNNSNNGECAKSKK